MIGRFWFHRNGIHVRNTHGTYDRLLVFGFVLGRPYFYCNLKRLRAG